MVHLDERPFTSGIDVTALPWWVSWFLVVPFLLFMFGSVTAVEMVPSMQARFTDSGEPGLFIGEREDCSTRGCTTMGRFERSDGAVVNDVRLGSGPGEPQIGSPVEAVHTGAAHVVYPRGGGWDWLINAVIAPVVVVVTLGWLYSIYLLVAEPRPAKNRQRRRDSALKGTGKAHVVVNGAKRKNAQPRRRRRR